MSRGQDRQANRHGKRTTRGERKLAKLGVRFKTVGLKRLNGNFDDPFDDPRREPCDRGGAVVAE